MDIYKRAINPNQYDLPDMRWEEEGTKKSPTRTLHYNYHLLSHLKIKNINKKSFLDIGCGMGQLLDELRKKGAIKIKGIEPSIKNVKLAKKLHPNIKIERETLEELSTKEQFDVITCVMVLGHIDNLKKAFSKIKFLLKEKGELYLIIEDYHYFRKPRHGYKFLIKKINNNETAIAVYRRYGLTADIIRKVEVYKEAAKVSGLILKEDLALKFTDDLIKAAPRYKDAKNTVINHLLIFGI